ncbi:MAG: hypothetical protein RMJ56_04370 [Gemmataceae bacterium]|nr:hypothetical protein [Gemmata sp.]MDW8196823.1 hypothetical protein [Gemmataceae bacterium]
MTNDAKLGMFTGVVGVVVAAALWSNPRPPEPPPLPASSPPVQSPLAAHSRPPAEATAAWPPANTPAPQWPSSPGVRTRPEVPAQPASRPAHPDDEP